jgi:hypothetical protein
MTVSVVVAGCTARGGGAVHAEIPKNFSLCLRCCYALRRCGYRDRPVFAKFLIPEQSLDRAEAHDENGID